MSILINKCTRAITQGMAGETGTARSTPAR